MRARDIMTKGVLATPSGTPAEEAWQMMRGQGIHHLLVGSATRPVGILSERDLGGRAGAALRKAHVVEDLAARDIVSVPENETVRKIANTMRGRSIGCVLVNDGRRTTGIITVSDLLALLGRGVERPAQAVARRGLHHRVPHRKRSRGDGTW
ncbi:MAG: HPP family protein [Vicinamibacterales bacterium]